MKSPIGEIKLVAFNFIPKGYVLCDGSRFNKFVRGSSTKLYEIVGDAFTYDNSDPDTFAIPDLRDRFIKHSGDNIHLGERKGRNEVVLSMNQMPEHSHNVRIEVNNSASDEDPNSFPNGAFLNNNAGVFSTEPTDDTFLGGITQENVGQSEPIPIKNAHIKMVYIMCITENENLYEECIGEIRVWPNAKSSGEKGGIPEGWRLCNGDALDELEHNVLLSIIGYKYGGNVAKRKFKLPDFRNKFAAGAESGSKVGALGGKTIVSLEKSQLPSHSHIAQLAVNNKVDSAPYVHIPNNAYINRNAGLFSSRITSLADLGGVTQENKGGHKEVDITNSSLGLNYIICTKGVYNGMKGMLGEVKLFAGFHPERIQDFASCYGQLISFPQNTALYGLIGARYGGSGTTFRYPDLRNKIPICANDLNEVGKSGGANKIKLIPENLPTHNHNIQLAANTGVGTTPNISNGILNQNAGLYSVTETENTYLGGVKEQEDFTGEKIDIRNPFLAINYMICIDGVDPIR